ncbi:hypothetical protein GYMLUDRAFT_242689 [Collybiopsis luxurians FD-317 M1]|uniref:Uncharacterized protein n=1 Tax=Collybiopsis luxurians FD-317 M1 TaxID=944289 RepID=A0A0D0CIP5_9AGAR|nr:hypothetical protein GYMLUDRAFT_242689 [Collybiopsis luxurians FD-317 M1]
MFSQGLKQFWIEEIAQLSDGTYVLPHNWIYVTTGQGKELQSDCSVINVTPNGWIITDNIRTVPASNFIHNYDNVIARVGDQISWHLSILDVPEMPNQLRALAEDEDLFVVMVPLWCNDVLGNKSKQYSKHINIYSVNGSLPGQLLQQEYFVKFVSTSPHATALEQFTSLRDEIKETEKNPIRCYNAATGRMCRTILRVPMLPANNPAQSEEASHMGGNSNHPCRKCKVGGSYQETETPEGYHCFFCDDESIRRSANEIKAELSNQLQAAMTGVQARVSDLQTQSGIKDKITETWIEKLITQARAYKANKLSEGEIIAKLTDWLEKQPGEKMNPLLDITGLDPSQDTPVEILHTILLGIMKYIWYISHTSMSEKDLELLAIRLQSTDVDGLTVPPLHAAYMVQYRNNLIGKHFKTLMQILPFHVHNFIKLGSAHFHLIQSVGALGPLLWAPEIENLEVFLSDLEVLVGNVLDAFADVAPSKILVKIKIHLLTHLPNDIRRFGPPIRYSTEVFEAFNAVFRLCSIYSNHQAPSRDISIQFADMGRVKHILSGGFWPQKNSRGEVKWVQASTAVTSLLKEVPIIQRHLGWVSHSTGFQKGHITFRSQKKALKVPWEQSEAAAASKEIPPSNIEWLLAAQSDPGYLLKNQQVIGHIREILLRGNSQASQGVVTLEKFHLGANIHEDFLCPILCRQIPNTSVVEIQFRFSAQHDCRLASCQATHCINQVQERQITERTQLLLKHTDDDNFIINMYALHNAMLLRKALPRNLWQPVALYEDRQKRHEEVAKILVVEQGKKRAQTLQKTQASWKRKKEEAEKLNTGSTADRDEESTAPETRKKQKK